MRSNILKIIFIIIVFNSFLFSQQVEISATVYSIVSGYTSYNQIKDRNYFSIGDPVYKKYSKNWHALQTLEAIALINVGIQIEVLNQSYLPGIVTDVFLTGAIRWIVRDGTYQLLLGNSFFNQSENTTAQFESFGSPFIKITFLTAILLFKYFLLPLLL